MQLRSGECRAYHKSCSLLAPRHIHAREALTSEAPRIRQAVVSNASVWDTAALTPAKALGSHGRCGTEDVTWPETPSRLAGLVRLKQSRCGSFMHLHLGLRAEAVLKLSRNKKNCSGLACGPAVALQRHQRLGGAVGRASREANR